jgi:hypothetical protein
VEGVDEAEGLAKREKEKRARGVSLGGREAGDERRPVRSQILVDPPDIAFLGLGTASFTRVERAQTVDCRKEGTRGGVS